MIPLAIAFLCSLLFVIFFPFSFPYLIIFLVAITILSICLAWQLPKYRRILILCIAGFIIGNGIAIPQLLNYQKSLSLLPKTDNYEVIIQKVYPNSEMVEATIISSSLNGYTVQIYNVQNIDQIILGGSYKGHFTIQMNRAKSSFHKINPRLTHLVHNRIGTANLSKPLILIQTADFITSIRTDISNYIQNQNFKNSHLMSALSVGLTNDISQTTWDLLRQTGTIHLVAISGLHLTFLALWCFIILKTLLGLCMVQKPAPYQIAAIGSLIIVIIYAMIAGMSLPTQRALIMFGILMIALIARYPILNLYSLATALFIVLILSPFSIASIGFWLSFTAVLILMLLGQYQLSLISSLLLTQIIISLLAIPIVVSFFNEASLISPVANLFAIPWTTLLILPFLLIGIILLPIFPSFSHALLTISDGNISVLINFLHIMDNIPFSHIEVPYISLLSAILITVLALLLLTKIKWKAKALCCLAIFLLLLNSLRTDKNEYLYIFPVGQGLSALLKSNDKTLLFDTGTYFRGYDSARTTILPTLKSMNIHQLDNIVLSHDNQQHIGGTRTIRKAFPSAEMIVHKDLQHMIDNSILCKNYSYESSGLIIQPLPMQTSCAFNITMQDKVIWLIANLSPNEWNKLIRDEPKPNVVLFPNKGRSKGFKIPTDWDDVILIGSTKIIHSDYSHHNIHNAYYGAIKLEISADKLSVESASDKEIFWWARPIETI